MANSYDTHDPVGWCGDRSRGAALGRVTIRDAERSGEIKLHLRRVRLNDGGYDRLGTYFGHGAPLYWCGGEDAEGREVDFMLRASDRDDAKAQVLGQYPAARFYN